MKDFISLYLIFLSIFFISCDKKSKSGDCCKKESITTKTTTDVRSDITLFDITSTWTTQDGKTLKLSDFKSKVILMAMIFTNCEGACPRITADLLRIEQSIPKEKLKDVSFVLVTMDPWRDNPQQLKSFAKEYQLDPTRWTLLTGSESDILEISNVLNVRIKKDANGNFDHSNIIHVLNDKGNIVYQQIGLNIEPTESLNAINQLLSE